jgi:membrane protein DedA with SNARE-associated domain
MHLPFDIFGLIGEYGYLAVFIGSIFEGESVILLAGLLANQNYLSFPLIIGAALAGSLVGDTGWFLLGRKKGAAMLEKCGWLKRLAKGPSAIVAKRPVLASFGLRFMYGLRHIIPFLIGMSPISFKRFFALNAAGAVLWVFALLGAGYFLGSTLEAILGNVRRYELTLVIIAVAAIVVIHLVGLAIKVLFEKVVED